MKKVFLSLAASAAALSIFCIGVTGCSEEGKKARLLAKAEADLKAGSYERAKIEYINLLRLDQETPEAYRGLGLIWMEQGAPLRALPFLIKARDTAPSDLVIRQKTGNAFLSIGRVADARKEALYLLKAAPDNGDALFLLASTDRSAADRKETEGYLAAFPDKKNPSFLVASSNMALASQDLPKAQQLLNQALENDPKAPLPHLAIATIAILRKDLPVAESELKIAADLSSPRSTPRLQYAQFLVETGKLDEAAAIYSAIAKEAPDFIPVWDAQARLQFKAGQSDEALKTLKNVFSRDPENLNSRILEAQILFSKGNGAGAMEVLERIDRAYPGVPGIKYQLARTYLLENNVTKAVSALKQALAGAPDYADAIILLGQLDLRAGNTSTVISSISNLLKTQPTNKAAEILLADAYRSNGRLSDAEEVIRRQITRNADSADSQFYLGIILRQQNRIPEARAAFEIAHKLNPSNTATLSQLVELDLADQKPDDAAKRIAEQLALSPNAADLYYLDAKVLAARKDYKQAEARLERAIELDQKFTPAYDLLIALHMEEGNLPQAIAEMEKLSANSKDKTKALMLLGTARSETKEYDKSREAYESLLSDNPDFVPALNNLAYLYSEQLGNLDKAADLARKAWNLRPNDPVIADTLGWILFKKGQYAEALPYIQEAATKIPDNAEVQLHLGLAEYMMGNEAVARTAFEKAVASPTLPDKPKALEKLAILGSSTDTMTVADLQSLVEKHPDDVVARLHLGSALETKKDFPGAAAQYEETLRINPKIAVAVSRLARLYNGPLGDKAKAESYAKQAIGLAQNDSGSGAILGEVALQNGEFDRAYSLLREGLKNQPDDARIILAYATAAYSLGRVEEARALMQRLAERQETPEATEAILFLSLTQPSTDDPEKLEKPALEALKSDPNSVPALLALGAAQMHRGDSTTAEQNFSKALQLYPQSALAQKALAQSKADTAPDEASDLAMKARKTRPDDHELAQLFAKINYKRKDYRYALQLLDEVNRAKPLDAEGLYLKGMSQFQLKMNSQSKESLKQALAKGLKEPAATEARQTLKQLDKQ